MKSEPFKKKDLFAVLVVRPFDKTRGLWKAGWYLLDFVAIVTSFYLFINMNGGSLFFFGFSLTDIFRVLLEVNVVVVIGSEVSFQIYKKWFSQRNSTQKILRIIPRKELLMQASLRIRPSEVKDPYENQVRNIYEKNRMFNKEKGDYNLIINVKE